MKVCRSSKKSFPGLLECHEGKLRSEVLYTAITVRQNTSTGSPIVFMSTVLAALSVCSEKELGALR